jgi:hypothetical protein
MAHTCHRTALWRGIDFVEKPRSRGNLYCCGIVSELCNDEVKQGS